MSVVETAELNWLSLAELQGLLLSTTAGSYTVTALLDDHKDFSRGPNATSTSMQSRWRNHSRNLV